MWRPSKLFNFHNPPTPHVHICSKSFHPLDLGRPASNSSPSLNDNQSIKKNLIQRWLSYVIRSFLKVGFHFQYQLNNLVWFSFTFHLAEASLSVFFCSFILLCVEFPKDITKCLLFIISHIFSTNFSINMFYLHNLNK